MKILLVSSEVVPFAKTGGLADVCGALPAELARLGHETIVCLPAYRSALACGLPVESTDIELTIPLGGGAVRGRLLTSRLPDSEVPVWLVAQDDFFARDGLYQQDGGDYRDNCARFSFFCQFALELLRATAWYPDVVHCNDWQTGLIPAHLATRLASVDQYRNVASLMTIHNLAYQGHFAAHEFPVTGMDPQYFNWQQMEFHEHINLLKTGIVFADAISTVSPQYAREIQTPETGCGLENVLRERQDRLFGVLNGIDTTVWNPRTDPHLSANYDDTNWQQGKRINKAALQQEAGLAIHPDTPLIGLVGRLATQKGWSLILPVMAHWLATHDVQWVVLGTGEPFLEDRLRQLQHQHPGRIAVHLGFSDSLAHQIESAADIFLMPSRYEPCGLNQQYSMQYGTVPVVHRTGGLADTVLDASGSNLAHGRANGFVFDSFDPDSLESALGRAVATLVRQTEVWQQLVHNGMTSDWSWSQSAARYEKLYQWTCQRKRQPGIATV